MESAFGTRTRPKIRRIRSSFHLDEKELKECPTQENQCERSPISEVAFVETPKKFRLDPQQIIKQAYRAVTSFGSSTACVGALDGKTLKIANIGDSTMMVVRYNLEIKASKIMLRTGEQQHNFNAPYQLANIPHGLTPTSDAFEDHKRKFWKDKVSDAVLYQTTVREGDIIIGGTDGLFDNLYPHEVQNIIDVFMNDCFTNSSEDSLPSVNTQGFTPVFSKTQLEIFTKRNAKLLAHDLVKEAKRKSKNKACFTPFADRFNQAKVRMDKLLEWKGGKPDDICAVVGFVKNSQP